MATGEGKEIIVPTFDQANGKFSVIGTTPLILNRMSDKAKRTLLLPGGRKTEAEKQSTIKHDPLKEFRDSPYRFSDDSAPTYLAFPTTGVKGALMTAALDLPGARKTQIGRLIYVPGDYIAIYGEPRLFCAVVRNLGMGHVPDIRTRVIVPRWAATVEIRWLPPLLTKTAVMNLLTAAGHSVGWGDYRAEKGKGNYGSFLPSNADDSEFLAIKRNGRAAQQAAMENPAFYDAESEDLVNWWHTEMDRRGRTPNGEAIADEEEGDDDA